MGSADPPGWHGMTIELAGRCCRIFVDDPAWLAYLAQTCGRYQTAGSPTAQLYLGGRAALLPAAARDLLALAGDPDGERAPAWVAQVGGRTVSVEARKWLVIGPELGVCWARQPISSPASFYYNHLHPLLIEWLARSGVLYLHAGAAEHALTGPLLIVGPRHAGKTTTCLALVTAGCRFLSDDTVLLDEDGRAHTLLRPMHPERRLCEAWSAQLGLELGALAPLADGRLDLDPARWFADRVVARIDAPRTVILPWTDGAAITRCEPVVPPQAAAVLLAQIHAGVPPFEPGMLRRISELLGLPALRVHIGHDAFADPAVLWRVVRGGLESVRR
jgi:hypothetical protein